MMWRPSTIIKALEVPAMRAALRGRAKTSSAIALSSHCGRANNTIREHSLDAYRQRRNGGDTALKLRRPDGKDSPAPVGAESPPHLVIRDLERCVRHRELNREGEKVVSTSGDESVTRMAS